MLTLLPHQSLIKEIPTDLPTGQSDGGIISVEVASSQMNPVCQVGKNKVTSQLTTNQPTSTSLFKNIGTFALFEYVDIFVIFT